MQDETEYYDISRWEADTIDAHARRRSDSDSCRTTSMTFNFKTKEFYYITRNAGGKCEALGVTLNKLPKPRIAQIVDGSKIIGAEFAKLEKAVYEALSSDFRKKVDKYTKQEQKK